MFWFFARAYVKQTEAERARLETEIAFWRQAWRAERQRANLAFDRLLSEKRVAPITGPTMPDEIKPPTDEDALHAEELAHMAEIPL